MFVMGDGNLGQARLMPSRKVPTVLWAPERQLMPSRKLPGALEPFRATKGRRSPN